MRSLCWLSAFGVLFAACADAESIPTEESRPPQDRGEAVYEIVYEEISQATVDGPERADAFAREREPVIEALNGVLNDPVAEGLAPLLAALPAEGKADRDALSGDLSEVLRSLAELPGVEAWAAWHYFSPVANDDTALGLLSALIPAAASADEGEGDTPPESQPGLLALVDWVLETEALWGQVAAYDAMAEGVSLGLWERFHPALMMELPVRDPRSDLRPIDSVQMDERGSPRVLPKADGSFPRPFVDHDGDGRVDVDAYGRPVANDGRVVVMPAFASQPTADERRDARGRASKDGAFIYAYQDLGQSYAAYLLREIDALYRAGHLGSLGGWLQAGLGPVEVEGAGASARVSYGAGESPALDALHWLSYLGEYERLDALLAALRVVLEDGQEPLEALVLSARQAQEIMASVPSAQPKGYLWDDLAGPVGRLFAQGLWSSVAQMAKVSDGRVLAAALARLSDHSEIDLPAELDHLVYSYEVDRLPFTVRVEESAGARSLMHQWLDLMADIDGVPLVLRLFDTHELPDHTLTEDLGAFYLNAIARRAVLDLGAEERTELFMSLTPEFNSRQVEAEELHLYLNHSQPTTGQPVGRSGVPLREADGPALFAFQASGALSALRPFITQIVVSGGEAELAAILSRLSQRVGALASADRAGLQAQEAAWVRVLSETSLIADALAFAAWSHDAGFEWEGRYGSVSNELDRFFSWLWEPGTGQPNRDGSFTIAVPSGGEQRQPSRLQLGVAILDRWQALAGVRPAWEALLPLDATQQWVRPEALPSLMAWLELGVGVLQEAVGEPGWGEGVRAYRQGLEAGITGRAAAAWELLWSWRDTPELEEFWGALMGADAEAGATPLFVAAMKFWATEAQRGPAPGDVAVAAQLAHQWMAVPDAPFFRALRVLRQFYRQDGAWVEALVTQTVRPGARGGRAMHIFADALFRAMRVEPDSRNDYREQDFLHAFDRLHRWDQTGRPGWSRVLELWRQWGSEGGT